MSDPVDLNECKHLDYILGDDVSDVEEDVDISEALEKVFKSIFEKNLNDVLVDVTADLYPSMREEIHGPHEARTSMISERSRVSSFMSALAYRSFIKQKYDDSTVDDSKRLFSFDFGRLDAEVNTLKETLDSINFSEGVATAPMPGCKSLYDAMTANTKRAGIEMTLNRVSFIFEARFYEGDKKTKRAEKDAIDIFSKLVARTDAVFAKELGHTSGFLLIYPTRALLMMEAPEISITDIFCQFRESPISKRVTNGKLLAVSSGVILRYMDDWTEVRIDPPTAPCQYDLDPNDHEHNLAIVGNRLNTLWKKVRREKMRGDFTYNCLKKKILPEIELLDYALTCPLLRSFETWIQYLTDLKVESTEDVWPEPPANLPSSGHLRDHTLDGFIGSLRLWKDPPGMAKPDLDEFLAGGECKKYFFDKEGKANLIIDDSKSERKRKSLASNSSSIFEDDHFKLKDIIGIAVKNKKRQSLKAEKKNSTR